MPSPNPCHKPNNPLSCECRPGACSYLSLTLSHNPTKVLVLIPYQHPICSATKPLPLQSWHHYDAKFHTVDRQLNIYCMQATRFTGLDIHWWLNRMVLAILSKLKGQLRQQWTSTQMLLVYTAGGGGATGQADGSIHDGQ